jgi:predicted porin
MSPKHISVQDSSAELQPTIWLFIFLKEKVMKKSLIALAVASAVSAPAFAATSNVDIYGVLNMSVNFVQPDAPGQDSSNPSITSTASRIGFKGAEDLGGGLSAIWQVESGFNADEQSGTLASRNTFLGLKGGWGTALLGNHDTPMKMLGRMVDNFGDTMGDSRNILGADSSGKTQFDLRTKNTVAYVSPDFGGFSGVVAYVSDWNANPASGLDNTSFDAYSLNGTYKNGPLMLGGAYEKHKSPNAAQRADMWRLVGGFDIAGFKLAALYENMSGNGNSSTLSRDAYGLFGSYAMGAFNLKANYLNASKSDAGNDGADQWTIGADYALSKRTTAYAYYAKVSNDSLGGYGLGANDGGSDATIGNAGSNPDSIGFGVRHSF